MLYGNLETVIRWANDPSNREGEIIRITYLGSITSRVNEQYDCYGFWWYSPEELAEETDEEICPRCGKISERMGPSLFINGIQVCEACYTHYITKWQTEINQIKMKEIEEINKVISLHTMKCKAFGEKETAAHGSSELFHFFSNEQLDLIKEALTLLASQLSKELN